MTKKLIGIAVIAIMLFGVFGLSGCSNGKTFEVDGWTLFRYNGNYGTTPRGTVNIVSANSESLVVDGVLNIPAKIGKYVIHGFGRPAPMISLSDTYFSIAKNLEVERIVLAAELYVNEYFYRNFDHIFGSDATVYVEFLSETFDNIRSFGGGGSMLYVLYQTVVRRNLLLRTQMRYYIQKAI